MQDVPQLPDYEGLKSAFELEQKAIMKVHDLQKEDEDLIRSVEDATFILGYLQEIQTSLYQFFVKYPSLTGRFKKDFISLSDFFDRNNVVETCFLYDCLLPEKEMFYFGHDGGINDKVLELHKETLMNWCKNTQELHEKTQTKIHQNLSLTDKLSELECQCVSCVGDFRTKIREKVYEACLEIVEQTEEKLEKIVETASLDEKNHYFHEMQRDIEKIYNKVRNKLKRASLNRLESQLKNEIKSKFYYPSPLAQRQAECLKKFFKNIMAKEGHDPSIVTAEDFEKFFRQMSSNLWRGDHYLSKEFQKTLKSILLLKRKDISANILKEYLGEFWIHSQARQIKRKIVYHMGPTNSGKTYHAIQKLSQVEKGCYLAPLRLLAGELYDTLNERGVKTTLLTGEEVIEVEGATHYSSTIEMARFDEAFDCCVIDEIQMISDNQRGWAWTRALVNIFAQEVHICGDPSVLDLVKQIVALCGDELEVQNYQRMTDLIVEPTTITLGELEKNDALIVFSRRNALRYKADLERLDFKVSIVYGRLSPEVRREQARKFDQGETDIIVSTDAIAMGMNLPIKRIIFSTLSKYIDNQEHPISYSEIKQIAGRAGRYKRFPVGHVTCLSKEKEGLADVRAALSADLEQKLQCMVGPDLDIFNQVNQALIENNLEQLRLSEFLRLFYNMSFKKPFYCVELKEMIELAEMVEEADIEGNLSNAEIFGFACAPVNLGLMDHVQYYVWILNNYVRAQWINNEPIDYKSDDIDYLETSIKCVELYQWLSRHFNNKHFQYDLEGLLENKAMAVERLNSMLSEKIVRKCSSCGVNLDDQHRFPICDKCFKKGHFRRGRPHNSAPRKSKAQKEKGDGKKKPFNKKRRFRPKSKRR